MLRVLLVDAEERVDGIDLRGHQPGEILDSPQPDARLLIAEQWALPERRERDSYVRASQSRRRRHEGRESPVTDLNLPSRIGTSIAQTSLAGLDVYLRVAIFYNRFSGT